MKSLQDLFEHQLKDLYSAENQLLEAIPKMIPHASDAKLKKALEGHLKETKKQKERLEEVCKELGIDPKGESCKAMKGLITEAEGFLKEEATSEVKDAGIIAEAQRIEHYEISGYGTAVRYATELGHSKVAKTLKKTLKEEYGADDKLNAMAEKRLNRKAKAGKKTKTKKKSKAKKNKSAKSKAKAKKKAKSKDNKKPKGKSKAKANKKAKGKSKAKSKKKVKSKSKDKRSKLANPLTIAKDVAKANKKASKKAKARA